MTGRLFLRNPAVVLGLILLKTVGLSAGLAAEKLKIATPVKLSAVYALPALAAEEKGFWQQEGLQAEWFPFSGGTPFIHALAAGEFALGMAGAAFLIPPLARRGINILIVADLKAVQPFYIWLRTDSQIKRWNDLEGAKIGGSTLGSLDHSLVRAATKAMGLERKIKLWPRAEFRRP